MSDTADLRAAAQAATPGPWYAEIEPPGSVLRTRFGSAYRGPDYSGPDFAFGFFDRAGEIGSDEADAAYISLASPDRILGLLSERDELRAALSGVAAKLEGLSILAEVSGVRYDAKVLREAFEQARAALEAREPAPSSELEG